MTKESLALFKFSKPVVSKTLALVERVEYLDKVNAPKGDRCYVYKVDEDEMRVIILSDDPEEFMVKIIEELDDMLKISHRCKVYWAKILT